MTKKCSKCKKDKSLLEFNKNKSKIDGLQTECKKCQRSNDKIYRNSNKDKVKEKLYFWTINNRGKANAKTAKRRSSKLNRTPKWLSEQDLKLIEAKYAIARWLSNIVGISYHVDHIIPLQGKNVSGLHIPNNLQILKSFDNLSKGNKHNG